MHFPAPAPAPDSPPDLTDSKSSKSSSLRSPSLSDLTGPQDNSHFEEITLDDVKSLPRYDNPSATGDKRDSAKAFAIRSPMALPGTQPRANGAVGTGAIRDLTNGAKPKYPGLQAQINGATKNSSSNLSLPSRKAPRRSVTASAAPSLLSPGRPPRTPSPGGSSSRSTRSPRHRYTAPPASPTGRSRSELDFRPGSMPTVRRQSWQPGRKTVEELEAEYHDSDEDLPDDAVMWNVPMSPRPPHQRMSRSPSMSSVAESTISERHHASAPAVLGEASRTRSPSRSTTGSYAASTHSSIPEDGELNISRTKSWTDALGDMSKEARELTEALEEFAGESERQREARIQSGAASARPSVEKNATRPAMVQLPPVQKGNIMIDPLPVSKEKEKVLSRTRPSWLPPKSQKEERKHLKEYQRMMVHAQEAEKRMVAKQQELNAQRDDQQNSLFRIWEQHVIPNWDAVIMSPRTREIWWHGITPRSRCEVWKRAIGNDLGLSETSFNAALRRAKALDAKLSKLGPNQSSAREAVWFESIRRDANEAFPELKIFQTGGPLHQTLIDVLMAYSMYRSDVGYVHGTHLTAALLILNMSPSDAFIALANILNRPLPMAFLVHDTNAMRRAHDLVLRTLAYKLPRLHTHLTKTLALAPEEFLDPLFRTLFCCRGAGLDIASRIWDVYVFEGDKALVRAAVGTLDALEGRLYGEKQEVLELLGWRMPDNWAIADEDAFMRGVRNAGKVDAQGVENSPSPMGRVEK
ncbi:uncharacterized protein J3D65DRAFT_546909 [Phyllosticta citribraziliensis]|uniref:Rab-GAP TBC domain-containing protein n=1 Tax=Phyllosticta citribraziliensis TaxID=989973 RepID=A0ABR1M5V0_9PEZI